MMELAVTRSDKLNEPRTDIHASPNLNQRCPFPALGMPTPVDRPPTCHSRTRGPSAMRCARHDAEPRSKGFAPPTPVANAQKKKRRTATLPAAAINNILKWPSDSFRNAEGGKQDLFGNQRHALRPLANQHAL
jgi:hypothetical protein